LTVNSSPVPAGRRIFYRVGPALATRHRDRSRLAFVAFDVVWLDGADLKMESYEQRRARLEHLELAGVATIVPTWPGTAAACLLGACDEQGVEGIVLKRLTSRYFAGQRSNEWRKLKTRTWITNHAEHRRPVRTAWPSHWRWPSTGIGRHRRGQRTFRTLLVPETCSGARCTTLTSTSGRVAGERARRN
jgi:ATP dependent DNA ligase domain